MVHAFLPGATQPVPAGKLQLQEEGISLQVSRFIYGLKYLKRYGAIEIDPVGLGMLQGQQVAGLHVCPTLPGQLQFGLICC